MQRPKSRTSNGQYSNLTGVTSEITQFGGLPAAPATAYCGFHAWLNTPHSPPPDEFVGVNKLPLSGESPNFQSQKIFVIGRTIQTITNHPTDRSLAREVQPAVLPRTTELRRMRQWPVKPRYR